ncbi:hypothetical protein ACFY5D_14185 [Paeniglutamicibacter sp. NPDC012692]|uniref:hypothetical protein n=1 Tax=Paeniglutamicibacter sp. NPDC012692 TaxID=3364388 RepID=UPI0036B1EFDE
MSKNSRLAVGNAVALAALGLPPWGCRPGVAAVAIAASNVQAAQTPSPDKGNYSYNGRPQTPEEVTQEEFEQRTKILDEAAQREQPDFGIEHLDEFTE